MDEVTIRGAGIFGLSIAWECARRGAKVTVVDPHGVAAGSSGGIVGALAPHVPENWNSKKAFQFESLIMAEAFWRQVEQIGGKSAGYARLGRVQPVLDAAALDLARQRGETATSLWQGLATWNVTDTAPNWSPVADRLLDCRYAQCADQPQCGLPCFGGGAAGQRRADCAAGR